MSTTGDENQNDPRGPYGSQPRYGQHAQQPQQPQQQFPQPAPGQPGGAVDASGKPKRPVTLTASMGLQLLTGVVMAIAGIASGVSIMGAHPTQLLPAQDWEDIADFSVSEAEAIMGVLGGTLIVGAVILAIPYFIFAFVSTRGSNVGRILATIYLALSIFSVFFGPWNLLLVFLPSIAALVLLWLPPSNAYVRQIREAKHPGGPGPGGYGPGGYGPGGYDAQPAQQQSPYGNPPQGGYGQGGYGGPGGQPGSPYSS